MELEEAVKYTQEHPDLLLGAAGLDSCKDGKCDI
jgi:hypothetical protein